MIIRRIRPRSGEPLIALDWGVPRGPYITLTELQWQALVRQVKATGGKA
jgi:hypothetical protein